MTTITPKFQLHVTGLNMLSRCGEQFRRRYVEHEKTPPSVSMAVGTAVDKSVTANLARKIEHGDLLSIDNVQDIARDALVEEWALGVQVSDEDRDDGIAATRADAIDSSVSPAALHRKVAAPTLNPTHVQRSWVLDIVGLDIQLAGTIDIQEGSASIRDTKTSARSPVAGVADSSLQLTTYALAVRQHDGAAPDKVALDFLIRTPKRHETKFVPMESTRNDEDFGHLINRAVSAEQCVDSGIFTPAPLDAWWCTPKFCPYHATCRYAKQPLTVGYRKG